MIIWVKKRPEILQPFVLRVCAENRDKFNSNCNFTTGFIFLVPLGKYAALWPFLGICAEVLILCLIILIYEKRRNKSELEESDTDPQEQ